ncbi:D-glycerate dehydrogenase [Aliiroseovarius sp. F20344]|uniref:2-hydroxyacid dehydrogenase n=1 Tax=Aliiroseovarius sp. F20344 TaxID=2926414 RepID=UPI001FF4EF1C|nr:D-glycerate dehydrogenase [Aliiroseovarius sp. F20344]MCK0142642.1 D-glycerate dehydrogenase [Aliiroseovarius sp. F20344]
MKLFISRPLPDAVLTRACAGFDATVRDITTPMTRDEMIASLQDYDIVLPTLGDLYSADVFTDATAIRARLLANFGVGYNHIDVDAAKTHGLTVTNTPGAVTDATADTAMTLILMTARRAGEGERLLRAGNWEGWHPTQLLGQHVSGKTVGIIGMGRIGEAIAKRCHFGFGMNVVFFNRSPKTPDVPANQLDSIEAVAMSADILVVAVPGGADTRHLIDAQTFAAMPPHAILINIARGEIVDEAALINALDKGQIAGAGLDVYEFEPKVPDALITRENVTLLPHLGTATLEVRTDMGMLAMDNIEAFVNGKPLPSKV